MVPGADARRQLQAEEAQVMEAMMDRIYILLLVSALLMLAICTSDRGNPR